MHAPSACTSGRDRGGSVGASSGSDGNGRLSRALAQAILARRNVLDLPVLPLGPVLRANARHHAGAMRLFASSANRDTYLSTFARAALRTAHAVLALAKATR